MRCPVRCLAVSLTEMDAVNVRGPIFDQQINLAETGIDTIERCDGE